MLVLSRRLDESIVINGNITVKILNIESDRVRIGIEAPKEVAVNRKEVQIQIDSNTGETQS